jgi:hypothetical protein
LVSPEVATKSTAKRRLPLWRVQPAKTMLQWNATVQPKHGHQKGALPGYNPTKPGRRV